MHWTDPSVIVSAVAATLTLCAVLVALFGRDLRAKFWPPRLHMRLANARGELVTVLLRPQSADPRAEKARYYHLRVNNPRRRVDAVNGVTVTLLRVEARGVSGAYHTTWRGDAALTWRNETEETQRRVIGTRADADLCHVVKDKWLEIAPRQPVPIDLGDRYRAEDAPFDLVVTVQARGNEVDSEIRRWQIVWDCKWEDGEVEMLKHFSVAEVFPQ